MPVIAPIRHVVVTINVDVRSEWKSIRIITFSEIEVKDRQPYRHDFRAAAMLGDRYFR